MFIYHENPAELNGSLEVPVVLVIINEMLADFLRFIRYVPFPIFIWSLTKNRRKNTKEMEKKVISFVLFVLIKFGHKNTYIYLRHRQVLISTDLKCPNNMACTSAKSVAYPGILFRRGSTNSVKDRGQGSMGGSPLVRGSGGNCNFVQGISFHIVKSS